VTMSISKTGRYKLLVAGVGGQGVIYITNLLTEAGVAADIPVASSEIHGIAQRRGSVVASVTFGENSFGFIEHGGADLLIGLEPLEAMRCLPFLNQSSGAVIDNCRLLPHSINVGKAEYPDVEAFIDFLRLNIRQVIYNRSFDPALSPIIRNIYILGRAASLEGFPLSAITLEQTIARRARSGSGDDFIRAFNMGRTCTEPEGAVVG